MIVEKIGFIGLGIMGVPMAGHIIGAGYPLSVFNRTKGKASVLADKGAVVLDTPAEVAQASDIIITMVSDTPDVEQVLFGKNGVYEALAPGKVVIDMSTISAEATRSFYAKIAKKGASLLDAPVSGGEIGAINATLTIMVGGDEAVFDRCTPLLKTMGKTVTYMGPSGAGQACKMCNQVLLIGCLMGVCEGFLLASKEGLDINRFIDVVSGGAGASAQLRICGEKIAKRDFSPGFLMDLMAKDLEIVHQAQRENKLFSPVTALAAQMVKSIQAQDGGGKLGSQAMMLSFEKLSGQEI